MTYINFNLLLLNNLQFSSFTLARRLRSAAFRSISGKRASTPKPRRPQSNTLSPIQVKKNSYIFQNQIFTQDKTIMLHLKYKLKIPKNGCHQLEHTTRRTRGQCPFQRWSSRRRPARKMSSTRFSRSPTTNMASICRSRTFSYVFSSF